jgi:hypothetical protein
MTKRASHANTCAGRRFLFRQIAEALCPRRYRPLARAAPASSDSFKRPLETAQDC